MNRIAYIVLAASILSLTACATRVVQTRTIVITQPSNPPVLVGSSYYPTTVCNGGCCGYGACNRGYWACAEYNLPNAQCGFWQYRAPRWSSEVVVYRDYNY